MDTSKVDLFLITNAKYFESYQIPAIKNMIQDLDDDKFILLHTLNLKDPTISIILSLFAGLFAVDRFYVGDIGLGIIKLLTCGGSFIWIFIDWFIIMERTRQVNYKKLQQALMYSV
jgi:TM2 domain-containing membrane protein YozV